MSFERKSYVTHMLCLLKEVEVRGEDQDTHKKVTSGVQVRYDGNSLQIDSTGGGAGHSESEYFLSVEPTSFELETELITPHYIIVYLVFPIQFCV